MMKGISDIDDSMIRYSKLPSAVESTTAAIIPQSAEGIVPNQDTLQLSSDFSPLIESELAALRHYFPHLNIVSIDELSRDELSEMAASLGGGNHLLISQSFLERMGSSQADYLICQQMLSAACQQLGAAGDKAAGNGAYLGEKELIYWTAQPKENVDPLALLKAQQKQTETLLEKLYGLSGTKQNSQADFRLSVSSRNFGTTAHYSRLANAHSRSAVQTVMSEAHRSMASLRMVAALGSTEEQVKARRTLRSLNKLLARGQRKMKRLDQETLTKMRKRRAEQQQKQQQEIQRLKQELEAQKLSRRIADGMLRQEGLRDIPTFTRHRRYVAEDYERILDMSMPVAMDMPAVSVGEGAEFAAADVTLSTSVSF